MKNKKTLDIKNKRRFSGRIFLNFLLREHFTELVEQCTYNFWLTFFKVIPLKRILLKINIIQNNWRHLRYQIYFSSYTWKQFLHVWNDKEVMVILNIQATLDYSASTWMHCGCRIERSFWYSYTLSKSWLCPYSMNIFYANFNTKNSYLR